MIGPKGFVQPYIGVCHGLVHLSGTGSGGKSLGNEELEDERGGSEERERKRSVGFVSEARR